MQKFLRSLILALSFLMPLVAFAAIFPDVSDGHPYKAEVEFLVRAGVIKGNPDGKFYPERQVNRAEFLKLLYAATNRTPNPDRVGCFPDIERGSWYESYVCDAASKENGFVQGYSDGKFRPGSPVSRTEALKMITTVFKLNAPDISALDKELIKFVDISVSAWYTKYISAAFRDGILPIAGQEAARFYPDKELLRGEAAAYIYNALHALERQELQASSSSSSSVSSTSARNSSSSSSSADASKSVTFPFNDAGKFMAKKPVGYVFTLKEKVVVHVDVLIVGFYSSDVTCRLYLLDKDGFSYEYYLGVQTAGSCVIHAAVKPGTYQLQIQPTAADVGYSVNASVGVSDGNDGFSDAIKLTSDNARAGVLEARDLYDWYTFTPTSTGESLVDVAGTEAVSCIIYTPSTVDQFGFSGPQCGVPYKFEAGVTYVFGVGRKSGTLEKKVTYTVRWR